MTKKNLILVITSFFLLQAANCYCQNLNFTAVKTLWLSSEKDLDFSIKEFTKSTNEYGDVFYQRNRKTVCSNGDSVMTTYNETFQFSHSAKDDNGMIYSTYSQSAFNELIKQIRSLKKIGSMYSGLNTHSSVYFDGKYYYTLYILELTCLVDKKTPLNLYSIVFYKTKPTLIETK